MRIYFLALILFFSSICFGESSLILEEGKEFYELGLHVSILEDPSGKMTIDDVQEKKFKRSDKKVSSFGFSDSAFWIKLVLKNNSKMKDWVLRINYPDLDHISFFKYKKKWVKTVGGDSLSSKRWEMRYKDYIFHLKNLEAGSYYLKVKSRGAITIPLHLMSNAFFKNSKELNDFLFGGFLAILITMFFYNFFIGLVLREAQFFYYVGFILAWANLTLIISGVGRYQFIDSIYFSNEVLVYTVILVLVFLLLFTRSFLEELTPKVEKTFKINLYFLGVFLLLAPFLSLRSNLLLMAIFGIITLGVVLASGLYLFKSSRTAKFFILSFFLVLIGGILKGLSATGLIPSNILTEQSIYFGSAAQLILLSLSLTDKFKVRQEEIIEGKEAISLLLEEVRARLEKTAEKKTEQLRASLAKTEGMLSNLNKAIFSVDEKGIILSPVSNHSKVIFKKNIEGEHALNLMFFHFKDGSFEKEELVRSFNGAFGKSENSFLGLKAGLPPKVTLPDKERAKGRVLSIQYVPLYKESKIDKLMFIVDDITEVENNLQNLKEKSKRYDAFISLLYCKDKELLSKHISMTIVSGVEILDKLIKFEIGLYDIDTLLDLVKNFINGINLNVMGNLGDFSNLINEMEWGIDSLEVYKDIDGWVIVTTCIEDLSIIISCLMLYADSLNELHKVGIGPEVKFHTMSGFEKLVQEKVEDLKRVMVNILEYVFLVRSLEDLDEDKISNAPKKARLFAQYDKTISIISHRSRLISFFYKVLGKTEKSNGYFELSELLKQMPSKDKVTEAALVNNLITPYKRTLL